MTPMRLLAGSGLLAAISLTCPSPAGAQQDRAALISQGRVEVDLEARRDLFMAAAEPGENLDSLWVTGVISLGQSLLDEDEAIASLWLRWAARHGPGTDVSPILFPPSVISAYDAAQAEVSSGAEPSDGDVGEMTTSWGWSDGYDPVSPGSIEITSADPDVSLQVQVSGVGTVEAGELTEFPPGTYEFELSAAGFELIRLEREVLPGVLTRITAQLLPVLPDEVASFISPRVVRLRYPQAGQSVCTNGLLIEGGLVLTSLDVLAAVEDVEVDGIGPGRRVQANPVEDLAVIELDVPLGGPVPQSAEIQPNEYVWSVFYQGCGELTSTRARLGDVVDGVPILPESTPPFPDEAIGAPVIDRNGALIGLVTFRGIATDQAALALLATVRELMDESEQEPSGSSFPWIWVGGGAAAAALGGALLGGGGGGGNPTGGGGGGSTTGIEITFPGG